MREGCAWRGAGAIAVGLVMVAALPAQQWSRLAGVGVDPFHGVFDSRRGRFVSLTVPGQTTSEWTGASWQRIDAGTPPFGAPAVRSEYATACDPIGGNCYLFGGQATSLFGDLWRYDGLAWSQVPAGVGPGRRKNAAMAFDSVRRRLVLFGGEGANTAMNDVWEHNGNQWIRMTDHSSWSIGACMVFDRASSRIVLLASGTFGYAGSTWTQLAPDSAQPESRLAWDDARQRIVWHRNDWQVLREWTGTGWTVIPAPGWPSVASPSLWYDPSRQRTLLASRSLAGAVLAWDGATVQRLPLQPATPSSVWFHDPVRRCTVAFGGLWSPTDETWTWDGYAWTRADPPRRPPVRHLTAATFDSVRGVGLLYGGTSGVGTYGDFWSWDGSNWTLLVAPGPPPLVAHQLAFDLARGRAVLYGGVSPTGPSHETWEWDGTAWTQVLTPSSPTPVTGSMTYDPVRRRTVLVGLGSPPTWEYDGQQWLPVATPTSLPTNSSWKLAFDELRSVVVGISVNSGLGLHAYDGVDWKPSAGVPEPQLQWPFPAQLAWDAGRQRLLVFDGHTVQELQDTVAAVTSYGSNCGNAVLMARTVPRAGDARFGLEVAVEPAAVVMFALAGSGADLGLRSGCRLQVGPPLEVRLALADARGLATCDLPIPANGALFGLVAFAQAAALTAAGVPQLSQGLRLLIGE